MCTKHPLELSKLSAEFDDESKPATHLNFNKLYNILDVTCYVCFFNNLSYSSLPSIVILFIRGRTLNENCP